ncbi:MAG: aquaporin [Fimbriimonadaceae bacterium]
MNVRAYVAEFVGTFALVWVGIYSILHFGNVPGGLLGIALAHGLAIALLVTATGPVSGGHLNPAITIAVLMTRRIKVVDALCYIVVQVAAGFAAAAMVGLVPLYASNEVIGGAETIWQGTPQIRAQLVTAAVEARDTAFSGLILEAIATFFLVFTVFGSAIDKRAPKVGGLYIGLAVTMGILAIGPLTGAALNPARWFGPAMLGEAVNRTEMSLGWLSFVYVLGPIAGGVIAAWVYQFVMMGRDQLPGKSAE